MCRNNKGFTLIELLVALALLVILTGALYGTYFSVTAARERGGARSEARRELSTTLGTLRNEISSAFYTGVTSPTATGTAADNPGQNLQFVVEDRDSYGKPASLLQFTALTPPPVGSAASSDVEAVRYAVQEKEGVLTLTREVKDLYLQTKSAPYPVIDDIEAFLVECYDGNKWVKTWDTAVNGTNKLPDCVRVTVTMKGGEKYPLVSAPGFARKSTGIANLTGLGGLNLPNLPKLPTVKP
jgi:general secretion pathway protein J